MGLEPFPILMMGAITARWIPERDPDSKMEQAASAKRELLSLRSLVASAPCLGFSQSGGTPLNLRMMLASRLASPPRLGSSTWNVLVSRL